MIGIIAAMDSELNAVRDLMQDQNVRQAGGLHIYTGTIHNQPVAVLKCGVGKVMAAMAATILCLEYDLDLLLNIGVAGGLLADQSPMDLVVSTRAVQADFDTSPIDGPDGLGLSYASDQKALNILEPLLLEMDIPYHLGLIATQDLFMAREEDYARLLLRFPDAACSEMEGAAVAAVAHSFQVPFLIIRALSDVVHHEGNPMEFSEFQAQAAVRAARLLDALCLKMDEEEE